MAKTVWTVVERDLYRHLVAYPIIDVRGQSTVALRKLDAEFNGLMSKVVKPRSSLSCSMALESCGQLLIIVVQPMVVARTQERVSAFQFRMRVEVHGAPPLLSRAR